MSSLTHNLDQPKHGTTPRRHTDRFGRLSDGFVHGFGSARFLVGQTLFVIVWVALNVAGAALRWDAYPFVFLNLVFSTQAAYAGPLILLTQNRQDVQDRAVLERDRATAAYAMAETEFLAREMADLRNILDRKLDRHDMADPLVTLALAIEGYTGRSLGLDDDED